MYTYSQDRTTNKWETLADTFDVFLDEIKDSLEDVADVFLDVDDFDELEVL